MSRRFCRPLEVPAELSSRAITPRVTPAPGRATGPPRDAPAPRHGKSMATLIELEHLHNETDAALGALTEAIDTFWTLSMAIVILLMQAGFAMLEAGAVRV